MSEHFQIAKRDNNPNRDYLIINKFQSKHYPSEPCDTVLYSERMGRDMRELCPEGRCLVIVFAETAVGIGALAAAKLRERCFLISTTREELPEWCGYLTFDEAHSHAPEHKLAKRAELDFAEFEHVFIIDDELTTGNTVRKLAGLLYEQGAKKVSALAFLASRESAASLSKADVEVHALYFYDELPEISFPEKFKSDEPAASRTPDLDITINSIYDIRLGVSCSKYIKECGMLCGAAYSRLREELKNAESVEVIGTEECCTVPVMFGEMLTDDGHKVKVHGVTRSPVFPADGEDYPIHSRSVLKSLYDGERRTFLYNKVKSDLSVIFTDAENIDGASLSALCGACGGTRVAVVRLRQGMRTSYRVNDCRLLLKDVTGSIEPMSPEQRQEKMREGVHYSELLPEEYIPSAEYLRLYENGLKTWGRQTAEAVREVSERILREKGRNVTLVSLARAGTPVGTLIKRYLQREHGINAPHYSVSIIRGIGIDKVAMKYIFARHEKETIQFIDGWTGKGAITRQLSEALMLSPETDCRPAVLADPAGVCEIYGTREDIFIPCSCLNSIVSGLFSRTVLRGDLINDGDFHGAVCFNELSENDRTYEFIEAIEREMKSLPAYSPKEGQPTTGAGMKEAERIAREWGITDINLIKPSIGEATRVLLRRVPEVILLRDINSELTAHLVELAREKNVEVREYPLECYQAVGIINS